MLCYVKTTNVQMAPLFFPGLKAGKPLAWDVTDPDTYAESHITDTVSTPEAAAHQAAQHKTRLPSIPS